MRVLWISHFLPYPPTGHGALQRSHHLLMHTAQACETGVIAISRANRGEQRQLIEEARAVVGPRLAFFDIALHSGARLRVRQAAAVIRSLVIGGSYWEHLFEDDAVKTSVQERLRGFSPDVVLADTLFLARDLPPLGSTALAVTHHNVESELLRQRAESADFRSRWFWASEARKVADLERSLARRTQLNIMVSADDAERLRRASPDARTAVVPNGVDTAFFTANRSVAAVPRSLVFVGGMDWYPNRMAIDWLAEDLWPAIAADDSRRTVTVVGRHPPASIRRLSAVDGRVKVTGFVDDVRPYLWSAAIYVCPIRVGGGTRLKILDALAAGMPLVSTSLGVSGLGLEDGEHYLRAETVEEFVSQIRRLEAEPALARRIAEAGRSSVCARYSWDTQGRLLVEALTAAARSTRRGPP